MRFAISQGYSKTLFQLFYSWTFSRDIIFQTGCKLLCYYLATHPLSVKNHYKFVNSNCIVIPFTLNEMILFVAPPSVEPPRGAQIVDMTQISVRLSPTSEVNGPIE